MTPKHHPSDETLLRVAAGTLPGGIDLVVGAHVAECGTCRARIATFECVGGLLLDTEEATPLQADAMERVLAAAERQAPAETASSSDDKGPIVVDGISLPATLEGCAVGRWRWIGPGVQMSKVDVPFDRRSTVFLLKVGAGRRLPEHGHTGSEFTYVVSGSFSDAMGRYRPGDIEEADAETEHQPVVDPGGPCICLAAMEGQMRLKGLLGRLVQPLFGI